MPIDEKYPLALQSGTVLAGQFTIEKVLGQGGFGITYRAIDHKTNAKVALKEYFPDTLAYREGTTVISYPGDRTENYEYGKDGFLQEARTLAAFIGCENIVRIHTYFEENGTAYFAMDYIEGVSFDEYLRQRGGKISFDEAKKILVPIMDALNEVHSKGIIHRDVTPDNIYITNSGTVKLLDFGAARYSLGDKSRSLDVILKHGFAPKEQYTRRGKQGPFTDIYSLGATFYFALTGRRPPDSVERLDEDDLVPPSRLGVKITEAEEKAILQALNVQPSDRFESMADFKRVLLNGNQSAPFTSPIRPAPVHLAPVQPAPVQNGFPTPVQSAPVQNGFPTPVNSAPVQNGFPTPVQSAPVQNGFPTPVQSAPGRNGFPAPVQSAPGQNGFNTPVQPVPGQPGFAIPGQTQQQAALVKTKTKKKPIIIAVASVVVLGVLAAILLPIMLRKPADTIIIGNSVGNIKNEGISTQNAIVDDNYHSLLVLEHGEWTYVQQNKSGQFWNLCEDEDNLYYIYNREIFCYNFSDGEWNSIPELKDYEAYRFYLSNDYFYIYTFDEELHRVSRKTFQDEESLPIYGSGWMSFSDDCLFYVEEISDYKYKLHKVSASNFKNEIASSDFSNRISNLVVDNGYIYFFEGGSSIYIRKYDLDLNSEEEWNLDTIAQDAVGDSYTVMDLNVLDDRAVFAISSDGEEPGIYYYNLNTGKYDCTLSVGRDARNPNIISISGGYEVTFVLVSDGRNKYVDYDRSGNRS